MASVDVLSEDEIDENSLLVQFYEDQKYWLKNVTLSEVPPHLKYQIAILFYITSNDMDWMELAYELGLTNIIIHGIECKSRAGIPALFEVFKFLHQKSLSEIMKTFSERRKFNILKHMKPFIEGLAANERYFTKPSAPPLSQESDCIASNAERCKEKVSSYLQKSEVKTCVVKDKTKDIPPKSIAVFIQHALSKEEAAKKLAVALRKNKMRVILSKDIFPILYINHAQILKALNEKVDYIVPILSDGLQKQICSRERKVESTDAFETSCNRFLHDLLTHEYFNTFKNFRVRPVIDRSEEKDFSTSDPLLSSSFQLWSEVPLLIENLKVTKKSGFS